MEETKLFLVTFIAAFVGVLPPGLVNMSVAKTCLEKGKKSGMMLAVGAASIVFLQAMIAILLAKYIFTHPFIKNILLRTGVVVFGLMAIYFFIVAKKKKVNSKTPKTNATKSFLKGMMISALNIFPIPYFVALSAAINAKGLYEYDFISMLLFSFGAALGAFSTLYLYVICFVKIEKHTTSFSKYSNYFMAFLMLALVIVTLIRIYYPWN